jgi:valyl-tRNA synthetase
VDLHDTYRLGEAAKELWEFARNEECDWTIGLIKRRLNAPLDRY